MGQPVNNSDLPGILQEMNTQYNTTYAEAFANATTYMGPLIEEVSTNVESYKQVWITAVPKMRKWLGPRHIKSLAAEAHSTSVADYESTIGIPRNTVESDQWGLYTPAIKNLAVVAKRHTDELVKQKLQSGKTDLTFDGKPFFSTLHDLDPAGVQSNLLTSAALTPDKLADAIAAMKSFSDNEGDSLEVEPMYLIVPPQLEKAARRALYAENLPSAAGTASETNVYQNVVKLIVNPKLKGEPTVWYLSGEANGIRPITNVTFRQPNLVAKTNLTDDNVFFEKEFIYGVDSSDEVTLGLWFCMIRNEG